MYSEIMYLNDNLYFYVYLYWGKSSVGYIYMSHACKPIPKNVFGVILAFSFHMFIVKTNHKKMFLLINIFIPRRSGVKIFICIFTEYLVLHNESF